MLEIYVNVSKIVKIKILIPWSTFLLQKLIVIQLVKAVPTLYGTQSFITVFTRARPMPCVTFR